MALERNFMPRLTQSALAALIDHTLLKPDATRAEIERLCSEADKYKFASVCVSPSRAALATQLLGKSSVKVCTVIGFPSGSHRAEIKALEAVRAVADGALELDMVINIGAVKDRNWALVQTEIESIVKAGGERLVKVILEAALLTPEEIVKTCEISRDAGAMYVKTSTGFAKHGATVEAVQLMRKTVGEDMGVKASGGIRDYETLIKMVDAGANRIGTSSGVAILEGPHGAGGEGIY
jgi:deoxyribose-phosphate aldolase